MTVFSFDLYMSGYPGAAKAHFFLARVVKGSVQWARLIRRVQVHQEVRQLIAVPQIVLCNQEDSADTWTGETNSKVYFFLDPLGNKAWKTTVNKYLEEGKRA